MDALLLWLRMCRTRVEQALTTLEFLIPGHEVKRAWVLNPAPSCVRRSGSVRRRSGVRVESLRWSVNQNRCGQSRATHITVARSCRILWEEE